MSVTWPANARGPRLALALPSYSAPLDCIITNTTTGERMVLNLPVWDGKDLTLDWFRRTLVDDTGADRSSLIDPLDRALWHIDPLDVGANTLQIQMSSGAAVLSDTFAQTAGDLNGKSLDTGGTWASGTGAAAFKAVGDGRASRVGAASSAIARAGSSNYAACRVEVEVAVTASAFGFNEIHGGLARYVDASNYFVFGLYPAAGAVTLKGSRVVAGSATSMFSTASSEAIVLNDAYRVVCEADTAGDVIGYLYHGGVLLASQGNSHSSLATGGALQSGRPGLYDYSDQADIAYFDNFEARDLTPDGSYTGATGTLSWDIGSYG